MDYKDNKLRFVLYLMIYGFILSFIHSIYTYKTMSIYEHSGNFFYIGKYFFYILIDVLECLFIFFIVKNIDLKVNKNKKDTMFISFLILINFIKFIPVFIFEIIEYIGSNYFVFIVSKDFYNIIAKAYSFYSSDILQFFFTFNIVMICFFYLYNKKIKFFFNNIFLYYSFFLIINLIRTVFVFFLKRYFIINYPILNSGITYGNYSILDRTLIIFSGNSIFLMLDFIFLLVIINFFYKNIIKEQ